MVKPLQRSIFSTVTFQVSTRPHLAVRHGSFCYRVLTVLFIPILQNKTFLEPFAKKILLGNGVPCMECKYFQYILRVYNLNMP
jgi:hypothetical protein